MFWGCFIKHYLFCFDSLDKEYWETVCVLEMSLHKEIPPTLSSLENIILIMKNFVFPSQFYFPKVWLSHPLTELLPNCHLRCHWVINPVKPQAILPCNLLLFPCNFLLFFFFKVVMVLTTLHPPPLFSDSKFNRKNSPSLWLSPEVDGHQGQREHMHTIYMQLVHNLQNSQEMSGQWWAEQFLLSSFIFSSGFLTSCSSQAAMQSGNSGSQVIQRGGSRGGSRIAGRYAQILVPPWRWQHFRSIVSRDLCQRLPNANLCQNTEQLPLSEKAGTTEQPTNLSWWQANAILSLASCWGTLSLWAQEAACKSGFSLHESCSISIQDSRWQFTPAEEGPSYSQWGEGYTGASYIDLAGALCSSVLFLHAHEKAASAEFHTAGKCARAPRLARAVHWEWWRHRGC